MKCAFPIKLHIFGMFEFEYSKTCLYLITNTCISNWAYRRTLVTMSNYAVFERRTQWCYSLFEKKKGFNS